MFENLSLELGLHSFVCRAVQSCPTLGCQGGGRFWKAHISHMSSWCRTQSWHSEKPRWYDWNQRCRIPQTYEAAAGITRKPVDSQLGLQSWKMTWKIVNPQPSSRTTLSFTASRHRVLTYLLILKSETRSALQAVQEFTMQSRLQSNS